MNTTELLIDEALNKNFAFPSLFEVQGPLKVLINYYIYYLFLHLVLQIRFSNVLVGYRSKSTFFKRASLPLGGVLVWGSVFYCLKESLSV